MGVEPGARLRVVGRTVHAAGDRHAEILGRAQAEDPSFVILPVRGGHDPHKIYAAYASAVKHQGQPTVILAKTIKGFGMGKEGESQNITHQQKKMGTSSIRAFRDRFDLPVPDDKLDEVPYLRFEEGSPEDDVQEHRGHDGRQHQGDEDHAEEARRQQPQSEAQRHDDDRRAHLQGARGLIRRGA